MTDLEKDLREILLKYGMNIYEISILLVNNNRNILAISFKEVADDNE